MSSMFEGSPTSFPNPADPVFNLLYKTQMSIWAFNGNLEFLNLPNGAHSQRRNSNNSEESSVQLTIRKQPKQWPK